MASLSRRISSILLAAAMVASLAEPSLAQVSPGAATVGPAGGTPSTTAPSNSEGTPSGGTGVVGQTRTGAGGGFNDGRIVLNPQQGASAEAPVARRPARAQRRAVRAQQRRRPAATAPRVPNRAGGMTDPAGIGAASSAGLNGSNAQSR